MKVRALLVLAGLVMPVGESVGHAETACTVNMVGLDPSDGLSSGGPILGEGVGQSFYAADSLILSLTVWRVASQAGGDIGMHPYIVETDSAGTPLLDRIVHEAPTLINTGGDGTAPTPFRWDFDPPVALPRPGTYAFFLFQDPCRVYFDILATEEDAGLYDDGIAWLTGRSFDCTPRSGFVTAFPRADLIFQLEFCATGTTPVSTGTWGRLKVIYR